MNPHLEPINLSYTSTPSPSHHFLPLLLSILPPPTLHPLNNLPKPPVTPPPPLFQPPPNPTTKQPSLRAPPQKKKEKKNMPAPTLPQLTPPDIDDLLHDARTASAHDLLAALDRLAKAHNNATIPTLLAAAYDGDSGNGVLHMLAGNGRMGK